MTRGALHSDGFRRLVTAAIVLVMLVPVVRNDDGLPLSTYPMYAGARADTLVIVTASGVASDGERLQLSMPQIAQTRDPLIAQSFLNDAAAAGTTATICAEIAGRADAPAITIEISRERHDVVAYAAGDDSLVDRERLVACEVAP